MFPELFSRWYLDYDTPDGDNDSNDNYDDDSYDNHDVYDDKNYDKTNDDNDDQKTIWEIMHFSRA